MASSSPRLPKIREGSIRRNRTGSISRDYEKTDEETGETRTIHHYEYTVEYAGDSYYAENVFHLTDEQMQTAEEYAANLHLAAMLQDDA
mgnify:CR=1 FL=1